MDTEVSLEARISLCRTGTPAERCSAVVELEEMGARSATPVILELLTFPDAGVRANAACALGKLGDVDQAVALMPLLHDPDPLVRLNAIQSLGLLRYAAAAGPVCLALRGDPDSLVRVHAAEALGALGDPRAVPDLLAGLADPDEQVRAYAADSIGALNSMDAAAALRSHLAAEQSIFVKAFLLSALHRLGDEQALSALVWLSTKADDLLAATVLGLAVELATASNAEQLGQAIAQATASRPTLAAEVKSLTTRLLDFRDHS